jgi:hypothetical protein
LFAAQPIMEDPCRDSWVLQECHRLARPVGLHDGAELFEIRGDRHSWLPLAVNIGATALWTHKGRRTASCGAGKGKGLLIACASGHAGKRNICCIDIVIFFYK